MTVVDGGIEQVGERAKLSEEEGLELQDLVPDMAITGWDALYGDIYHKDDMRLRLGTIWQIRFNGVDTSGGGAARRINVNPANHGLTEELAEEVRQKADRNAEGASDAMAVVEGSDKLFSKRVAIILCAVHD